MMKINDWKCGLTIILFMLTLSSAAVANTEFFKIISFEEFEIMMEKSTDKIRIYNFWATWCAPCVKEMPGFEKVNAEDPDVELIFVSLDDGRKPERVTDFIQRRGIKAPVFLLNDVDYNKWIDKVSPEWSGVIPATLFIQPNGDRSFHEGELEQEELISLINQLKLKNHGKERFHTVNLSPLECDCRYGAGSGQRLFGRRQGCRFQT